MKATLAALLVLLASAPVLHGQDLRPVVDRIAAAWQRGDVSAIGAHTAERGIAIVHVGGERIGPLAGRQATGVLRRLIDQNETVTLSVGMAKEVGGEPRRAFAELNWVTRARGSTIPQRSVVLVALELEHDRWRITEIRLLR